MFKKLKKKLKIKKGDKSQKPGEEAQKSQASVPEKHQLENSDKNKLTNKKQGSPGNGQLCVL